MKTLHLFALTFVNEKVKLLKFILFALCLLLNAWVNDASAQTLYWIGGSGYWSDNAHWSLASGDITCSCVPTANDDVHFDANSFSSPDTVTIDASAYCKSMDWTGAANTPELTGGYDLNISGSLTFIPAMTAPFTGAVSFLSSSTGNTITSAGKTFSNQVLFDGVGGEWILQDAFANTAGFMYLNNGTLNTNNQNLACYQFHSSNTNLRSLILGTSTVSVFYAWDLSVFANMFLDADASTLNFWGANANFFSAGDNTYHNINFQNTNQSISGNSVFNNVNFTSDGIVSGNNVFGVLTFGGSGNLSGNISAQQVNFAGSGNMSGNGNYQKVNITGTATLSGINSFNKLTLLGNGNLNGANTFDSLLVTAGKKYTLESNQIQTVDYFKAIGTCTSWIWFRSNSEGSQATISKVSGNQTVEFVRLRDIRALGGATFAANNSTDLGNNDGWTITPPSPVSLNIYWVGGTGEWNDGSHWSLSSGGPGGACIPTLNDDVFFDANSFTSGSQFVSIDDISFCKSMDWTGAAHSPAFTGAADLYVYGSLTFIDNMSSSFSGRVYFKSNTTGRTIASAGKTFSNNIYFDGTGGGWTLQDAFATTGSGYIYLNNGSLNTNSKGVGCYIFHTANSNARELILGSTTLIISYQWDLSITTNMNFDAGTSNINLTNTDAFFRGGDEAYHDLNFLGLGYQAISGNHVFNNVTFAGGGQFNGNNVANEVSFGTYGEISGTTVMHHVSFWTNASIIGNNSTYHILEIGGNGTFTGTNTFDSLLLSPGMTYTFGAGQTQTINYLRANGTCSLPIALWSNTISVKATISSSSASIIADYIKLRDIKAIGSAAYSATNVADLGNNTGWNLTPAIGQNLYWVGGSGNWNDASHWAASSSGTGGACVPNRYDDVHFDAGSFSVDAETVTVDISSFCKSMNWTGATHTPVFQGTADLYVYGSLTFISAMSSTYTGVVFFKSTTTGNTITSAGISFSNQVTFDGAGGVWTLQDSLVTSSIYLNNGTLTTNNQNLTCNVIYSANYYPSYPTPNTNNRVINLGSSTLTIGQSWQIISPTNFTVNPGTSTINFTGTNSFLSAGDQTYYDVNFLTPGAYIYGYPYISNNGTFHNITYAGGGYIYGNYFVNDVSFGTDGYISGTTMMHDVSFGNGGTINGYNSVFHNVTIGGDATLGGSSASFHILEIGGNGTINGNNTFDSLLLSPGKTYTFGFGQTQTINYLGANGTAGLPITIQSSSSGSEAFFSKASGAINGEYLQLHDNHAIGGATFTANNSTDLGNNDGWFIIPPPEITLYWVGGTGNWNDVSHWSLTSGGASCTCLPTINYNVRFDANSFPDNDTVTVDAIAYCKSMDWTGATNAPVLAGASELDIYGSLTFISAMSLTYTGVAYFKSTTTGNTITSAGIAFAYEVTFEGAGGEWTLQDAFVTSNGTISLNNGTLTTNNQNLNCQSISSAYYFPAYPNYNTNNRAINLGSSTLTIGGGWQIYSPTNFTVNPGTSTINFTGAYSFLSAGDQAYYDVNFLTPGDQSSQGISNGTFHNITFAGGGHIYGSNVANDVSFGTDGFINGSPTMHDVSFGTSGTINGYNSSFHNVTIGGDVTLGGTSASFHILEITGNGTIYGNNTFDSLLLSPGKTYTFAPSQTQTINYLGANGTCSQPIALKSVTLGSQATFSSSSASIAVENIRLGDIDATGGAIFTANNSIDFGNNTGWVLNQPSPLNLYWVGGTGDWYDVSHWSLSSGGAGGACVPTLYDDVHFDANSFSIDLESVTLDAAAYCRSMDWTGATHSPVITGSFELHLYGSLTLIQNLSSSLSGIIYFNSTATDNTITSAGISLSNQVTFEGAGGEWTLQDAFVTSNGTISLNNGTLTTNNQNLSCQYISTASYNTNNRVMNLGSSPCYHRAELELRLPTNHYQLYSECRKLDYQLYGSNQQFIMGRPNLL